MARYYEGGKTPWVKSGELRETVIHKTEENITDDALKETNIKLVQPGAILLAMYGATVGRLGILGVPATTNQAVCHIIPAPELADTRYVFHALLAQVSRITAKGVGGAQPNISQGVIKELLVYLPSLVAQKRIAAILDKADALRAKRRKALEQLDALAQAIFIEMFGDPTLNPKKWDVGSIGELLESASYGSSAKAGAEGSYPILRMGNITNDGKIDLGDLKYIDLAEQEAEKYLVRAGDVLFNRTNSAELVGKSAIYRFADEVAYAGYLVRLRVNSKCDPEYLAAFLNTPHAKRVLRSMCKSIVGMANINAKEVQSIRIAIPPIELQKEFGKRVRAIEGKRVFLEKSRGELDALFSSLQHRAFRGEL
ncbi:restriction endonuclease subunit S [Metapseudomonas otitidis]|uniref:restriction endonuclease subunit S n=1 Tax=Metapseudomonas otitidis TaxID=319939 RepID=UPI00254203F2|nr:restriction endonuclease subunit S [Pseudomonas otitidis]WIF66181.1 restriction endonuclease subunit S [Pseudomonas otitidis]